MALRRTGGDWLTRRELLAALSALGAAAACGDAPPAAAPPAAAPPPGPRTPAWDALEELRRVLGTSPDHLAARAERLVGARDPAALHAFVRDAIATLPPGPEGFGADCSTARRAGSGAVLRSGVGTPREKAELLAELYRRAGLQAEVVAGPVAPDAPGRAAAGLTAPARPFAPEVPPDAWGRWAAALGPAQGGPSGAGASAEAAASLVAPLLRAAVRGPSARFDPRGPGVVPLVAVQVDGVTRWANPVLPGAPFGPHHLAAAPGPAGAPGPLTPVTVRVELTTADAPHAPRLLVEGRFSAADVAGRTVRLAWLPVEPLDTALALPARAQQAFQPVLWVDAPGLAAAERTRLAAAGPFLTPGGDLLDAAEGRLHVNGAPRAGPLEPGLAAAAGVARLEVEPHAGTFPHVHLRVRALDASGRSVEGLPASAFRLEEGGRALPFTLVQQRAPAPRVLVLLDASARLPPRFRGEGARALVHAVATRVRERFPEATFRALVGGRGGVHAVGADWVGTPHALATQLDALSGDGSDLWNMLEAGAALDATVMLLVSDGGATDAPDAAGAARLAGGPPVVALGARGPTLAPAVLERMAQLTGGSWRAVAQPEEAAAALLAALPAQQAQAYVLQYEAAADARAGERTVRVRTQRLPAAEAQARYVPPEPAACAAGRRPCGVHLRVAVGGREVVRTLAGAPVQAGLAATAQDVAAVRALPLGVVALSFEAGAPTLAAALDDVLAARLARRPVAEALTARDGARLRRALLEEGVAGGPGPEAALQAQLAAGGDAAGAHEAGLRVVLVQRHARPGARALRSVEVLPLSEPFTAAPGGGAAARARTLRRTARLAEAARRLHPVSAAALLARQPLAPVAARGALPPAYARLPAARRAALGRTLAAWDGHLLLVPRRPTAPAAFWAVSPHTGAALAVLEDGSGAQEEAGGAGVLDVAGRLADVGAALGSLVGLGGALAAVRARHEAVAATLRATAVASVPPAEGHGAAVATALVAAACALVGEAGPELAPEAPRAWALLAQQPGPGACAPWPHAGPKGAPR